MLNGKLLLLFFFWTSTIKYVLLIYYTLIFIVNFNTRIKLFIIYCFCICLIKICFIALTGLSNNHGVYLYSFICSNIYIVYVADKFSCLYLFSFILVYFCAVEKINKSENWD